MFLLVPIHFVPTFLDLFRTRWLVWGQCGRCTSGTGRLRTRCLKVKKTWINNLVLHQESRTYFFGLLHIFLGKIHLLFSNFNYFPPFLRVYYWFFARNILFQGSHFLPRKKFPEFSLSLCIESKHINSHLEVFSKYSPKYQCNVFIVQIWSLHPALYTSAYLIG